MVIENYSEWRKISEIETLAEPIIRLKKNKQIAFNSGFIKMNKLEGKRKVELLVKKGEDKSMIGFIFNDNEGGKKLSKIGKTKALILSASDVFKVLNIDAEAVNSIKFSPKKEMLGSEELFYIEIPKNQIS